MSALAPGLLGPPPPPPSGLVPDLPSAFDRLVLACLAKDKTARVRSADYIRTALRDIRSRLPLRSWPQG